MYWGHWGIHKPYFIDFLSQHEMHYQGHYLMFDANVLMV